MLSLAFLVHAPSAVGVFSAYYEYISSTPEARLALLPLASYATIEEFPLPLNHPKSYFLVSDGTRRINYQPGSQLHDTRGCGKT